MEICSCAAEWHETTGKPTLVVYRDNGNSDELSSLVKKVSRTVSAGWLEGVSAQACSGKEAVGLTFQIQRCGVMGTFLSYSRYLSTMDDGENQRCRSG
jgi:hypothetical protein